MTNLIRFGRGTSLEVVTSGLQLYLDASNPTSYPGTGTNWYNLVNTSVYFTINATAYNSTGPKYMDFNGSYGCAKKIDSDFAISGDVTCVCWTRVKTSTTEWRTLLRGLSSGNDHQVIIEFGAYRLGMYDNVNTTGFNDSGFLQTNIPGYASGQWNMLVWRWKNAATPYYNFSYNDTPETIRGSNSNSNSRFKHGICSIGGYNNAVQSNPSNASQYWGDISSIMLYNKYLTDEEVKQNFNATKSKFGL